MSRTFSFDLTHPKPGKLLYPPSEEYLVNIVSGIVRSRHILFVKK